MTRIVLLLPSLALIACLQTAIASGKDNAGFLRGEYLRQLAHDLRLLDSSLPKCPGTGVYLYYDANITLETVEEEGAECTEEDMAYIRVEMEKFVKELESEYPKFSNEFLDTTLCAVPEIEEEDIGEEDIPTDAHTNAPTGKGRVDIKVVTSRKELPPWLAGPANRFLEKKGLVPTLSMAASPVRTDNGTTHTKRSTPCHTKTYSATDSQTNAKEKEEKTQEENVHLQIQWNLPHLQN